MLTEKQKLLDRYEEEIRPFDAKKRKFLEDIKEFLKLKVQNDNFMRFRLATKKD